MGIPKFFRYISERYPLTSQLIEENKIPEFDNLYVDFNGIIHNCSHPNDADAHFRLSEEQVFTSIFAYVDLLFGKIKPKKLFFMAVDGVAPRAKMNQQRGRRFRTAKEVKEVREKAERNGEKLPEEKAFDSNCITPGTVFMAKLTEQLKYFVNKKISEDANWRNCEVVLSGHDVPGEGEHKIMEYIRKSRAQPDYNPNVRHCLYGLDADLIMLGLLSHDPHFCLLREEVKFGPARKKHITSLEAINFYLLHLTLMREYLDLEFRDIENLLPFEYSLERVIDDFILLAVFIGNDFLPHLPDVHIHENGLERLFDIYKGVLPSLDGYLNESGVINARRLQVVLNHMDEWEREIFEREYSDMNWYKGKQRRHAKSAEGARKNSSKSPMTVSQKMIFDQVKAFVLENRSISSSDTKKALLAMPNIFSAGDKAFINTLAEDLHLTITWDEYDEQDQNLLIWRFPGSLEEPSLPSNGTDGDGEGGSEEWTDEEEEEGREAVDRVLKKYEIARVALENANDNFDMREEQRLKERMDEWKRTYYRDKLSISYDDPEQMRKFVHRYIEGMQWVMHYYYSGVCSWGWFYDYHYAPRMSDLTGIDQMSFSFELGRPFRPFEQLMGVLPAASRELIPIPYRDLMDSTESPILDFYPLTFDLDLNGKKQEWEAVVKIPFINESRLLAAMAPREHRLTEEENRRNSFGSSIKFFYNPGEPAEYPSSLPGFFPPLYRCQCLMEPYDLPTLDGLHLVQGLCDGVYLGADALAGFPSLKTLPHHATLGYHGVNVHGSESRNKSMIIHIDNPYEDKKQETIADEMIGQKVFVGWPFLQEGKIQAISNSLFKYEKMSIAPGSPVKVISNPHSQQGIGHWKTKTERIAANYSKRCGVITGDIEVLVHVLPLKGLKRLESGAFVKDYENSDKEVEHAVQMTLSNVVSEDPRFMEKKAPPLSEEFPPGSKVFFLGEHAYGVAAQVSATTDATLQVVLAFFPSEKDENAKFREIVANRMELRYFPSFEVSKIVGLSPKALSKITSRFMANTNGNKINLGLNLKFEAKSQKVINYSRKNERYWEFSEKTIDLIREYKENFPEVMRQLERNGNDFVKISEVFPGPDSETRLRDVKDWLTAKQVRDFEAVSLYCDKVGKETVAKIEELAASLAEKRSSIKKVIVNNIPRQVVLKPSHAIYRLQSQRFALGDRVVMVQDSGSVPLSIKGVVIGINAKTIDVVWDVAFMAGTTLGNRCSEYRGSTVEFSSCLNLSNRQLVVTDPKAQQPPPDAQPQNNGPFKPRIGPRPFVQPPQGQQPVAGFRPSQSFHGSPVQIMANPNRGRGWAVNGRGSPSPTAHRHVPVPAGARDGPSTTEEDERSDGATNEAPVPNYRRRGAPRGFVPRGLGLRGASPFPNVFGGRGIGYRGARGGPPPPAGLRGSYRGRGVGAPTSTVSHT